MIEGLCILLALLLWKQRKETRRWMERAEMTHGFTQELLERCEMAEIERFEDYIGAVGVWYENRKAAREHEAAGRRLLEDIGE